MVQILSKGINIVETCPRCGCQFSFLPSDAQKFQSGAIVREFIRCPQCNEILAIKQNVVSAKNSQSKP